MRLLYYDDQSNPRFTRDLSDNLPKYAILSHTWINDEEEVAFLDIADERSQARSRAGWHKLKFCLQRALHDGIEHVWMDTCCIDQRNNTELSEAINSMFKWYADAEVCYVYLSDVLTNEEPSWKEAFRRSRWFTRGWTLQELLAPRRVEFYSRAGQFLGSRIEHADLISAITGIHIDALRNSLLTEFSVSERFEWARRRRTKKPEDEVYCLLGIFGVSMPLVYGEGKAQAMRRLQWEISDPRTDASVRTASVLEHLQRSDINYDATAQRLVRRARIIENLRFETMDSRRDDIEPALKNTCAWLLEHATYRRWTYRNSNSALIDLTNCSTDHDQESILWIKGHPGAGKSTLVRFIEDELLEQIEPKTSTCLSFYFSARGDLLQRSLNGLYRALICKLLDAQPRVACVLDILKFGHSKLPDPEYFSKAKIPILKQTLSALVEAARDHQIYILVDALDETVEDDVLDMVNYMHDLADSARRANVNLFVCYASRHYPTLDISTRLQIAIDHERGHQADIRYYLERYLRCRDKPHGAKIISIMLTKANGIFIWIVLVTGILNQAYRKGDMIRVKQRLEEIPADMVGLLKGITAESNTDSRDFILCLQWLLFAGRPLALKEIYYGMIAGHPDSNDSDLELTDETISVETMELYLVNVSKGLAELTQPQGTKVQFIHQSIRDFLLDHGGLRAIHTSPEADLASQAHEALKQCCLRVLARQRSNNETSVDGSQRLDSSIAESRIVTVRSPLHEYACNYLLYHADRAAEVYNQVDFLQDIRLAVLPIENKGFQDTRLFVLPIKDQGLKVTGLDSSCSMANMKQKLHHTWFLLIYGGYNNLIKDFLAGASSAFFFTDTLGRNGLHTAVNRGAVETVEVLLQQGSDIEAQDLEGRRALHLSVLNSPSLIPTLLKHHPDTDAIDQNGDAAIHLAVNRSVDSTRALKWILPHVRDVDIRNRSGRSALHLAATCETSECVKILLDYGADVHASNQDGQTALHYAAKSLGRELKPSCVLHLISCNADIDKQDRLGKTPLHYAASLGYYPNVAALIRSGANTNIRDHNGATATDIARAIAEPFTRQRRVETMRAIRLLACQEMLDHASGSDHATT